MVRGDEAWLKLGVISIGSDDIGTPCKQKTD